MFELPTRADIERAADIVYSEFQPTPQYSWPLLNERLGTTLYIKHENHTPISAFKIRGGLVFFHDLKEQGILPKQVFSATRGNHGQSIGYAARKHGVKCTIVVPKGNSVEKNRAMRALGVHVVEHGDDFTESVEYANQLTREAAALAGNPSDVLMVPSFHTALVTGVATYWYELLNEFPDIDILYAPIGLGSGAVAAVAARDALNHKAEIVGVVSSLAAGYAKSFAAGKIVPSPVTTQLADGMAIRVGSEEALSVIIRGVSRIVEVSDHEVARAMYALYTDTHNVAEGAGAAAFAGALQEKNKLVCKKVGLPITGGNVDAAVFADVLMGG